VPDAALAISRSRTRSSMLDQPSDLEHVFSRFVDPVYRFLYSRVGNREDAEDLTSEVFLKATRQLDSQRLEASMAQWLFTVARTVLADHWRRYYRTGAILPLDDERIGDIPGEHVTEPTKGSSVRVAQLLGALPERYGKVLELRFLRGYSIQETAEELGITKENAKVIQHRALAKAAQLEDAE
jgi:RNA polymerase sigma-70 factor, ECF subfamily